MNKIRQAAAVAIPLLTAGVFVAASAPSASASSTYCSTKGGYTPDACAEVTSVSNTVVTIRTYAKSWTFYGHFELQTPNHQTLNSPDSTWHPGTTGHIFSNVNGGIGTYCVTAWELQDAGWSNIGYVCFGA